MAFSKTSKLIQYVGWPLVALYTLAFLFWLGVAIYVAVDTPSNLEHILFSTINIYSLLFLVLFLYYMFSSGDDWWENGIPSSLYMVGFWILSFVGMLASLFVMLRSILDSQFNNSKDENLLIALDATLFAVNALSFLFQLVSGFIVIFIRRPEYMMFKGKKVVSNRRPMPKRTSISNVMVNRTPY